MSTPVTDTGEGSQGLPRREYAPSPKDKRRAVELALKTWPDKTQQAVADQVGCSQRYVSTIQKELRSSSKLDLPATRTGADGKERPTTYEKREAPPARESVSGDDGLVY